jgi:hypothetical protein
MSHKMNNVFHIVHGKVFIIRLHDHARKTSRVLRHPYLASRSPLIFFSFECVYANQKTTLSNMSIDVVRPRSSLYANRKCLFICAIVAMANMQYGLDSSAVGALQAMPGFLKVFGYEDPGSQLGYGIDVRVPPFLASHFVWNVGSKH